MTRKDIKGYCDMPLPEGVISAMDALAYSFKMKEWDLLSIVSILSEEKGMTGLQLSIQIMRPAGHKVMGFKCEQS